MHNLFKYCIWMVCLIVLANGSVIAQEPSSETGSKLFDGVYLIDDDAPIYTALRQKVLFLEFDIQPTYRYVTGRGVDYETRNKGNDEEPAVFNRIHIAVHPNLELADKHFEKQVMGISAPAQLGDDIGSVYSIWPSLSGKSVTLLVRERNIVILFECKRGVEAVKPLVKEIIQSVQNDRKITSLGRFLTHPVIIDEAYAQHKGANKGKRYLKPRIVGLGNTDKLICSMNKSNLTDLQTGQLNVDGEFEYSDIYLKNDEEVELYFANNDNVFVSKKITLSQP